MEGYDLRHALAEVGETPQNFALHRGPDADQILVTPNPPNSLQLAVLDTECGPKSIRVLKGICFREGERLVFSTRNVAAPAWEKMIAKILEDRKCGHFLPIVLRQLGSDESDEFGTTDSGHAQAAPATPEDAALQGDWEALKERLMPDLRAAIGVPATREAVTKIVSAALVAERAGSYKEAIAALEKFTPPAGGTVPAAAPVAP